MSTREIIVMVRARMGLRSVPLLVMVSEEARTAYLVRRWEGTLKALAEAGD